MLHKTVVKPFVFGEKTSWGQLIRSVLLFQRDGCQCWKQHLDKSLPGLLFLSLTFNNLKRINLKKTPSIIAPWGRVMSLITSSKQKFINKSLICQFSFLKIPFASRKYLYHPIQQGGQLCAFVATKKQPLKWMCPLKSSIFLDALQD